MNLALVIEEPVEMIRVMPSPPTESRLDTTFEDENFEVSMCAGHIAGPKRSADPNSATKVCCDLLLTSRLTATETLSVRKILSPW